MPQDYRQDFDNLRKTSLQWRSSTSKERKDRIGKILDWIHQNTSKIHQALFDDFRKPPAETDLSEIFPATLEIKHTLKKLDQWMKPQKVKSILAMTGTSGKIVYEPKGVALIISPWNYPFNLTIGPLISAIAAGCPAIIKPSELTPHTSDLIKAMVKELFDPSEVQVIIGDVEVSQSLLEHPFDHIFFTGSPAVGKIIMASAAKNLSSVTLELGGKSPTIVHQDADLGDAASKIISGKFLNCGQTCVAPDYVLVHQDVKEKLLMELKVSIQKMYDPNYEGIEQSKDLARIINQKNFSRLQSLLEDAISKGAKIEFGGSSDPDNLYLEPTLLSLVDPSMDILEEEIFGPLLPIVTYSTLDDAISWINSKPKPLALYYFGKDTKPYDQVLKETSSGNVVLNDCLLHFLHPNLPFGGVNNSGIGKSHGYFGFLAFSNEKGVLEQRVGFNNSSLLKPPYDKKTQKLISSLTKWL